MLGPAVGPCMDPIFKATIYAAHCNTVGGGVFPLLNRRIASMLMSVVRHSARLPVWCDSDHTG